MISLVFGGENEIVAFYEGILPECGMLVMFKKLRSRHDVNKKVIIIHTGGTIGMVQGKDGVLRPLQDPETLLRSLPELADIAQLELRVPFNLDSSNIQPSHWLQLAAIVRAEQDNCDGFVILHGTDTIAYTAAALSFLLADVMLPIILTGAQRPLRMLRTDARTNIIDAVELATRNIPETALLFNNTLWRGNRAQKISNDRYSAFHSPNYPPLAQLGLHITLNREHMQRKHDNLFPTPNFNTKVMCLKLHPGFDETLYDILPPANCKAMILQGFGAGNIPLCPRMQQWLEAHSKSGLIIAIASQSPRGHVDLSLYEGGRVALAHGAISCRDMTIETSLIKMMLLQGTRTERAEIEQLFTTSLAGELSEQHTS